MNRHNLFLKTVCGYKLIHPNFKNRTYKVSVLGAAGSIGQPLCFFLKKSPVCSNLSIYDIKGAKGVSTDLSHVDRKGSVIGYQGTSELGACLDKSDIVIIPAGIPRQHDMTKNERFLSNANIVADLSVSIAKFCPLALVCIVSDPINCTVPVAAEVLRHFGVFDRNKLFGVTTLDVIRSITFISQAKNIDVTKLNVPVIGGHSPNTIIPVMSQCAPHVQFPLDERNRIVDKIRNADTEITEAKSGQGSATLSMSWAAFKFVNSLMEAIDGKLGVIEPAYVRSDETECEFFSTPLILGKNGIERSLGIGQLTEFEINLLKTAIPEIKRDIALGKEFAERYLSKLKN